LFKEYRALGRHTVYIDKGFTRQGDNDFGNRLPKFFRVSADAFQATEYFQAKPRSKDRWQALGLHVEDWKPAKKDGKILVAGGSEKYSLWHGHEGGATGWATRAIEEVRKYSKRDIIYRPKPSWSEAKPISGTEFSRAPTGILSELKRSWALVTFGSNAAVDAICAGVPIFVTGDGIAKPMGLSDLSQIEKPWRPSDKEKMQWVYDLSYCQWSLPEFESGEAWAILRQIILGD